MFIQGIIRFEGCVFCCLLFPGFTSAKKRGCVKRPTIFDTVIWQRYVAESLSRYRDSGSRRPRIIRVSGGKGVLNNLSFILEMNPSSITSDLSDIELDVSSARSSR